MSGHRYLVDENCSPWLAGDLRAQGYDAVHVNEAGLAHAPDSEIALRAAKEGRTVITYDRDYVDNHRAQHSTLPSVIHLTQRGDHGLIGNDAVAGRLREILPTVQPSLERGAVLTLDRDRCRETLLPLTRAQEVLGRVAERRAKDPPDRGRAR